MKKYIIMFGMLCSGLVFGDNDISLLNHNLVKNELVRVKGALGSIPADAQPKNFSDSRESGKVLKVIEVLNKNINVFECKQCLNKINELFYTKGQQLIADYFIKYQQELVEKNQRDEAEKSRRKQMDLCDNLHSLYYTSNGDFMASASTMTHLLINVFAISESRSCSHAQKICLLTKNFMTYKQQLSVTAKHMDKPRIEAFIQELQLIFLEKSVPSSLWKSLLKIVEKDHFNVAPAITWTIAGVILIAVSGLTIYFLGHKLCNRVEKSVPAVEKLVGERMDRMTKTVCDTTKQTVLGAVKACSTTVQRSVKKVTASVDKGMENITDTVKSVAPKLDFVKVSENLSKIGSNSVNAVGDKLTDGKNWVTGLPGRAINSVVVPVKGAVKAVADFVGYYRDSDTVLSDEGSSNNKGDDASLNKVDETGVDNDAPPVPVKIGNDSVEMVFTS